MYRLYLDPDASTEGVTVKVPDVTGKVAETKVEAKAPAIDPAIIAKLAKLEALEAAEATRKDAERKAEEEKLRDKGKWEELLKAKEADLERERGEKAELTSRTKKSVLAKELATALSGHTLVPGASVQLGKLWSDEFEVKPDGDEWRVETRDRKSPAEFVREKLASDDWAHFVKAEARGGAGGGGGEATRTNQDKSAAPKPGSLEHNVAQWKAAQKLYGANAALVTRNQK